MALFFYSFHVIPVTFLCYMYETKKKGLASMAIPMYLAEAASSAERGMLVTLNVMFITGGQALAAVFSGALSNATQGWRYVYLFVYCYNSV